MKAKKVLQKTILVLIFVIIFVLFLRIMTYIMKPAESDLKNIAGFYNEEKNSLDMVYIGGSAAFWYYAPLQAFETEGIASYNYAARNIEPELYKTMVKEILKTQSPELIVIDARCFQYREKNNPPEEHKYRSTLLGMPLSLNKLEFIYNNVEKYLEDDNEISYTFDIIKYHRDLKGEEINDQIKIAFHQYKNPTKGFYYVEESKKQKKFVNKTDKQTPIADETEKILIDLLDYLKTTECNYLFVVSPYVEKEEYKENYNYISGIINSYGYDFVDFNEYYDEMQLDFNTDFYDVNHVNILGAEKYTEYLTKYLKQNYNLPNRKDDLDYKEWVELLEDWNKEIKEAKDNTYIYIEAMKEVKKRLEEEIIPNI